MDGGSPSWSEQQPKARSCEGIEARWWLGAAREQEVEDDRVGRRNGGGVKCGSEPNSDMQRRRGSLHGELMVGVGRHGAAPVMALADAAANQVLPSGGGRQRGLEGSWLAGWMDVSSGARWRLRAS
ncbi:hypothetical protein ZWY2020_025371 [Hordeum vulgare]|nr:hypothetical protein ZWY2020_025371 [Hordeum vulgare]